MADAYYGGGEYDGAGAETMEYGAHATGPQNWEGLETHIMQAQPKHRMTEDEKFAREVERRRTSELERRQRIFDAKRRNIGCDKPMLDAQVVEKLQRQKAENDAERKADRDSLKCDRHLKLMEIEKQRIKRDMEKECKETSLSTLNFASRSEYELNDPLHLRKGVPPRLGDDDPRTGPSGMQKFNGEDLMKEERLKQQKTMMHDFIEQQKFEKEMIKWQNQDDGARHAQEIAEITSLRNEMESNESSLRSEMKRAQQNDNLQKASDNQMRRMAELDAEQAANAAEVDRNFQDPFLNEATAMHHNGRVKRDMFKGFTTEEKYDAAQFQLDQRSEKEDMKQYQKRADMLDARDTERTRKQLVAMEREKARSRRGVMEANATHNKKNDDEHKQMSKCLDQMYTNNFSDDFWGQFGKGTR